MALPIEAVRGAVLEAMAAGSVVVTAPTGSGKSTQVPRWCVDAHPRVVVVEPRRVACKTLAARVLQTEYPREVRTADARYAVEIDLDAGDIMLRYLEGKRGSVPSLSRLPRFVGFRIRVDTGLGLRVLR